MTRNRPATSCMPGLAIKPMLGHGLLVVVVAATAFVLNFVGGNRRIMPLDQSIVFDGAWRVLSGQMPARDFFTPNGVTPILFQAAIFKIFGITWQSYVGHASVMNALFAVFIYVFLWWIIRRRSIALLYAIVTAYFTYPPMGTPFMDQHALIFSFVAIALFLAGALTPTTKIKLMTWFAMPIFGVLAFHSKQIPSGPVICVVFALSTLLIVRDRGRFLRPYLAAVAGGLSAAALMIVLAAAGDVSVADYVRNYFGLSSDEFLFRLEFYRTRIAARFLFWTLLLIPVASAVWFALRFQSITTTGQSTRLIAVVVIALIFIMLTTSIVTWNSVTFAFGFLPPVCALTYSLVSNVPVAEPRGRERARQVLRGLMLALPVTIALLPFPNLWLSVSDDIHLASVEDSVPGESVSPALRGLRWRLPTRLDTIGASMNAESYRDLLAYFAVHPGNFLLIGDATILYALSGRPSVFPSLWFHNGLSFPRQTQPGRRAFESALKNALQRHNVRYLVLDGPQTWTGTQATDFPVLRDCLARTHNSDVRIGEFQITRISRDCYGTAKPN